MARVILQSRIPDDQREAAAARLPAMRPVDMANWLVVDDAYAEQIAYKVHLMETSREHVCRTLDGAEPAVQELLDTILANLADRPDFTVADTVTCPDGREVQIDRSDPFMTLAQLVQEDLCLMEKHGDEHVLTAAILGFPAAWTLAEKIGRPLTGIHIPVPPYDDNVAKRVQRLFDGIQPGRAIWRANLHTYADPELHHRRTENDPRPYVDEANFERSERQTLVRLPKTGAVVFSIHTCMAPKA